MDQYKLDSGISQSPGFKVHQAWSSRHGKNVIVKAYEHRGILASEGLLKEAVRQARDKPEECADLIDVVLSSPEDDEDGTDDLFYVNFVLEMKEQSVQSDVEKLIARNDNQNIPHQGLNGYENIRHLAPANNGKTVQQAYSSMLRKDVVIKSKPCSKVEQANELLREAFLLAYVDHEYNCKLIDICLSKNAKFTFLIHIIMEKCKCDVYSDILKRQGDGENYTEEELLKFLQNVTSGLAHARSLVMSTQGIAHRDIKPQNIFIAADGKYKLGDFGIAWKKSQVSMTVTGAGTDIYWAPEVQECALGQGKKASPFLGDVYSLGVTLLQMTILAEKPFDAEPMRVERFNKISDGQLRDIVAADPVLKDYQSDQGLRQRVSSMLGHDVLVAVRLTIIRSGQASLRKINYSPEFKELLRDMIAVDDTRRISLAAVIERTNNLLSLRQGNSQEPTKLLGITKGVLRCFDLGSGAWEAPIVQDEMHIDEFTTYTFISSSAAVLCGSITHTDLSFGGVEVYNVELRGFGISVLPSFPGRRKMPGLLFFNESLFAFGGNRYAGNSEIGRTLKLDRDALMLALSSSQQWVSTNGEMSEGKLAATPSQHNLKAYICGENVDLFNLQNFTFESPLDIHLPEFGSLSFFSNGELVVISIKYLSYINVNAPSMRETAHEGYITLSNSPAIFKGDSLFWTQWDECHIATFKPKIHFRVIRSN